MIRRGIVRFVPLVVPAFVFVAVVLYPLSMLVTESLRGSGGISLSIYSGLLDLRNPGFAEAVWNSVSVSLLSVAFSGILGTLFAVVFTQTEFPLQRAFSGLAVLPIALPPLVGVIAFLFVFGESGIVPRLLQHLLGMSRVPFFLDGIPAIVAVHVYSFSVYFYLFVLTALRQMDASQVEAAANLGEGPWGIFWKVVLPRLRPALLGASMLTFMVSMASFSAPLIFAGGRRFITLEIYSSKLNGQFNLAAAQSVFLTLLSCAFFLILNRRRATQPWGAGTKGSYRVGRMPIARAVRVMLAGAAIAILLVELLPIVAIILISFAREGTWTRQLLPPEYTVENYATLLTDADAFTPLGNSLLMAALALAASVAFGVTAAYLLSKGILRRARSWLDAVLTLPYAVPGTIVAIAMILAYDTPTIFSGGSVLVGTFWILPLAYFAREYPLIVRSTTSAMDQVDDTILEAARSFGAGPWRQFRSIVLPLVLPGIVSGGLLVAIACVGEFVSSILLYTYANRPVAVEILEQLRIFRFGAAAAYSVILLLVIFMLVIAANLVSRRKRV